MPSLGVDVEDVGKAISRYVRGCHVTAAFVNSAEGGSLFLRLLLR